jgi:hypothetical protein
MGMLGPRMAKRLMMERGMQTNDEDGSYLAWKEQFA